MRRPRLSQILTVMLVLGVSNIEKRDFPKMQVDHLPSWRSESSQMPHYRIYTTTPDGHLLGPAAVIECRDDEEAIGRAARSANGKAAELWEGARLIVRFPSDEG